MFGLNGNVRGFLGSTATILDSCLGVVQSRVELFAAELREERLQFFKVLIFAAILMILGMLALALLTTTIIVAVSQGARLATLIGLTVFYALGAYLVYRRARVSLRRNQPLAGTIKELGRDREYLAKLKHN